MVKKNIVIRPKNTPPIPSRFPSKSLEFLGYPRYEIASNGKVWSWCPRIADWKEMKLVKHSSRGTNNVRLVHHGKELHIRVSHLVLLAFRGPTPHPGRVYCHHLDGDASNCALENLVWLPWSFALLNRKKRDDRLRPKELRKRKEKHEKKKAHWKYVKGALKSFLEMSQYR